MKLINFATLIVLFSFAASAGAAEKLPDLDDSDVSSQVDIRAFEIGDDGDVGNLFYIVDRTTGNCFVLARDKFPGGFAVVSCESLQAIEIIKTYMETGVVPK